MQINQELVKQFVWVMNGKVDHVPDIESVYDFTENSRGITCSVLCSHFMPNNHLGFVTVMRILTQKRVPIRNSSMMNDDERSFFDECSKIIRVARQYSLDPKDSHKLIPYNVG